MNSKESEKGAEGSSGKDVTKPKAGGARKEKGADKKSKQKPQTGKSKKGKQGKQTTVEVCEGARDKPEIEEKLESSGIVLGNEQSDVSADMEKKPEIGKELDAETQDFKKETEVEKSGSVTESSSDKAGGLKSTPLKELNNEKPSDSSESMTFQQKVEMVKSPSSQNITRPEPDHTEKEEAVLDRLAEGAKETKGAWGWGWGSSLLEVASNSVSTFTNQVGEGLHTMIESIETGLNVPNPEELAQKVKKQSESDNAEKVEEVTTTQTGDLAQEVSKQSEKAKEKPIDTDDGNVNDEENKSVKTVDQVEDTEGTQTQSESERKADGNKSGDGWFSSWGVSNITKIVENTGKTLVTGSLDVLETLGKKTFDVINEHDPGLKKARGFLHDRRDKPSLSVMLRDAKEQHEAQAQQEKESEEARKTHFGSLFDDFQGLVHLEALEMLSNQSEKRINSLLTALPAEAIAELKPQLLEIKENFEIAEDTDDVTEQDFDQSVSDLLKELNVGTNPAKLLRTRAGIEEKLTECCDAESKPAVKDIHQVAISSLAELTSKCIEQFHKTGEMILIQKSAVTDFPACSNTLLRLTKVLKAEVGILSTKFLDYLNKQEGDDEIRVNHLVTNIFLEASNSSSYIQDGFQLLLPVLQQAAIERSQEPDA